MLLKVARAKLGPLTSLQPRLEGLGILLCENLPESVGSQVRLCAERFLAEGPVHDVSLEFNIENIGENAGYRTCYVDHVSQR